MQVPLHPMIVHFPLAITFIIPVLIIVFALMIKNNKMNPKSWLIIVGLQLMVVITGYVSLETGETEEDVVEKVLNKNFIHEHEEAAEIFVGSSVLVLALSIGAFFIRKELGFPVKMGIVALSFVSSYLAYQTGELGGELVYKHGAAEAYKNLQDSEPMGILPTPGMNTSESPMPVDENESLKADENDYGNADEIIESPDDDLRQED